MEKLNSEVSKTEKKDERETKVWELRQNKGTQLSFHLLSFFLARTAKVFFILRLPEKNISSIYNLSLTTYYSWAPISIHFAPTFWTERHFAAVTAAILNPGPKRAGSHPSWEILRAAPVHLLILFDLSPFLHPSFSSVSARLGFSLSPFWRNFEISSKLFQILFGTFREGRHSRHLFLGLHVVCVSEQRGKKLSPLSELMRKGLRDLTHCWLSIVLLLFYNLSLSHSLHESASKWRHYVNCVEQLKSYENAQSGICWIMSSILHEI